MADRAAEQARSAMAQAGETAQDLANRAREQAAPAAQAVYDQGARAGEYVTRNVHQYPTTALLIAAAVGYGLAYLIHGGGGPGARTANSTAGPIDRPGPAADGAMTAERTADTLRIEWPSSTRKRSPKCCGSNRRARAARNSNGGKPCAPRSPITNCAGYRSVRPG